MKYRIELFGGVRIVRHDLEVSKFRTHKTAALLGYLALNLRSATSREQLIDLFWPDLDGPAARNSLSTALSSLRSQLEPALSKGQVIIADHQTVRLSPNAITTDVEEFDRDIDLSSRTTDMSQRIQLLEQVVLLYRGDVMQGCYDDWAITVQARLRARYTDALRCLAGLYQSLGALDAAVNNANRLIAIEPLEEEAYEIKMRAYAAQDRHSAVVETFACLEKLLREELAGSPGEAIVHLFEQSRNLSRNPGTSVSVQQANQRTSETAARSPEATGGSSGHVTARSTRPILPLTMTRFFGRQSELDTLLSWLRPSPYKTSDSSRVVLNTASRLITITGPGGAGKTRLALAAVAELIATYGNRVYFVPLADIPDASLLSYALSHSVGAPAEPGGNLMEETIARIVGAPTLLVLDNLEHLLRDDDDGIKMDHPIGSAAAAWVKKLFERAPELICLATSRRILGLQGEQEFALSPLPLPSGGVATAQLMEYPSVALYVDRARLVKPDFVLTTANADAVVQLCRRLDGMPLAIELAAAWARSVSPNKMLERYDRQITLPDNRSRDLPARHKSLRATFEWSYELLRQDLRSAFSRLALFSGDFSLEAAEAVCGDSAVRQLAELQEHSLVVTQAEGEEVRFRLLKPLRDFAIEKLNLSPDLPQVTSQFIDHFVGIAERAIPEMSGKDAHLKYDVIDRDFRNLMTAAYAGLKDPKWSQRVLTLMLGVRVYLRKRGHSGEALSFLRTALESSEVSFDQRMRSDLLSAVGSFAHDELDREMALHYHSECLNIRRKMNDGLRLAAVLHNLGNTLESIGSTTGNTAKSRQAIPYFEEAMQINRDLNNQMWEAYNLNSLGNIANNLGDHDQAEEYYLRSLQIRQEQQDELSLPDVLKNLGSLALRKGDFILARSYLYPMLEQERKVGDTASLLSGLLDVILMSKRERKFARTAVLSGAYEAIQQRAFLLHPRETRQAFADACAEAKTELGEVEFTVAESAGAALSIGEAVDFAIKDTEYLPS